ncbi:DUF7483 domain-containing protein [Thalassospira marina]|uniref:DUF7483 domain-containing protein n=1 Tax=Thalassospira marina TaxID=2048283 RepID=A0A2N3KSQ9_9PROT|nr:LamG-like jellyroll fold domain-containing protein [Thalassospira marina]PKR53513.1 hypothetical protein COO20_13315 [Thalassospira marina]
MSILFDNPPPAIGCGDPGDPIDFACRFETGTYLSRTPSIESDRTKWTLSFWMKRTSPGVVGGIFMAGRQGVGYSMTQLAVADYIGMDSSSSGGTSIGNFYGAGLFRDPANWVHVVFHFDSLNAVAAERVKLFVNGQQRNITFNAQVAATNHYVNSIIAHYIGLVFGTTSYLIACLADVRLIDGELIAPTAFAYLNAYLHWVPKKYAGEYGPNGFHLDFTDPLDLGKDASGNDNHWSSVGLTVANQVTDTPTNNCPTWNPLSASGTVTWRDGNRQVSSTGNAQSWNKIDTGTMLIPATGKWYWEWVNMGSTNFDNVVVGLLASWAKTKTASNNYLGREAGGHGVYIINDASPGAAANWLSDGVLGAALGASMPGTASNVPSAVIGAAFDAETGDLEIFVSNVSRGVRNIPLSQAGQLLPAASVYEGNLQLYTNPHDLTYAPPAGYKPLTSASLPCPAILNPDDYFTVRLSSGGADVTDLPWDPMVRKALVVSKRIDADEPCVVTDTVNGAGFAWETSSAVNGVVARPQGLTAFNANGYAIGSDTAYQGNRLDLIWQASPRSGFDIVTVDHTTGTPTTVPQLSGSVIEYGWVVRNNAGQTRRMFHHLLGNDRYFPMNAAGGPVTDAGWFSSTANTVTLGASLPTGIYTLYVWRSVRQFSSFGRFAPNDSNNGPFLPLDFLPRLFQPNGGGPNGTRSIFVDDLVVNGGNDPRLALEAAAAAVTAYEYCDFLSNGVKARGVYTPINYSDTDYYYSAAWARTPGKFARAR